MATEPEPTPETHIIRVHTGEGAVYARYMEPVRLPPGWDLSYAVCGQAPVPEGLDQQGVVNYFRAQGWRVEQDVGTDFANPEWEDETAPKTFDCSLCGRRSVGFGHNPQPLIDDVERRCCDECNRDRVVPARLGHDRHHSGAFGLGKPAGAPIEGQSEIVIHRAAGN